MNKLLKVLAVAIFAFTPIIISSPTSAQAMCEVGYTGPDSQNLCKSITEYTCNVTNSNEVAIVNQNNQVVASGIVNNSDNSQTGNSTSGSVTNNNGTKFLVTITNPGLEGTCMASAVVLATQPEVPTPTPVAAATPVQPTAAGGVAALPKTSGGSVQATLVVITGLLASIVVIGVGSVALYRYYKSL